MTDNQWLSPYPHKTKLPPWVPATLVVIPLVTIITAGLLIQQRSIVHQQIVNRLEQANAQTTAHQDQIISTLEQNLDRATHQTAQMRTQVESLKHQLDTKPTLKCPKSNRPRRPAIKSRHHPQKPKCDPTDPLCGAPM